MVHVQRILSLTPLPLVLTTARGSHFEAQYGDSSILFCSMIYCSYAQWENLTSHFQLQEVCEYCLQEPPTAPPLVKEFTTDYLKKITIYFWLGDERVSKLLTLLAPICKSLEDIKLIPSTPPGVRAFVSRVQRIIKWWSAWSIESTKLSHDLAAVTSKYLLI